MGQYYQAAARKNPGRRSWLVEFRHPLKIDRTGRLGKKTRKGLGTDNDYEAEQLVAKLNNILSDESLWSLGARAEAERRFGARVAEIFYAEIEPHTNSARHLRDKILPFPIRESEVGRVLLIGVPGAGKTTLLRQFIGSHPEHDRFPAISVNRTTTFATEVITGGDKFRGVVTFLSEHEARFEIEECVSDAILQAVQGDRMKVAHSFLECSDMRFRLKYVLGDYIDKEASEEEDPYASDDLSLENFSADDPSAVTGFEAATLIDRLNSFLERIQGIADRHHKRVAAEFGALSSLNSEDKNAALDLIQTESETSDEYVELVSDILDELRLKFDVVTFGKYEKSPTGWPSAWSISCQAGERREFLSAVRFFSGISVRSWGKLLTPLVNGIRVEGPFVPRWGKKAPRLVFIDTEGLSHKANVSADLPEHIISLFGDVDCIALVDSAKNAMTHFAAGKALEAIVSSGHTRKLVVAFTHMDAVSGENLRGGRARADYVFAGIRNVVENQVAKAVSNDLARYLLTHLERHTFFLGSLDKADAQPANQELQRLLDRFGSSAPMPALVSFPRYSTDKLAFAIQEATQEFRKPWRAWLGIEPMADTRPYPWQSIKAMTRRHAEGWDDGYPLRPTSNLLSALIRAISRFLETPLEWRGQPTEEEKREVTDQIKRIVTKECNALSQQRLREKPQLAWQSAYALRGRDSTFARRMQVETIYERWVPIPHSGSDKETQQFLDEVKNIVLGAVNVVEDQVKAGIGPEKNPETPPAPNSRIMPRGQKILHS
jgi:hypothetical protein